MARCRRNALVFFALALVSLAVSAVPASAQADPNAASEFTITDQVLRPADKVPPLGANDYGKCGAVEWARNNFVANAGNEPVYWKNLHRIMDHRDNWFKIDGGGVSWYDLWGNGFLSGADVRIYRIVGPDGAPIVGEGYLDMSKADHVELVGRAQIIPEGSRGYPDGGWVVNEYGDAYPNAWIRNGNLSAADVYGLKNEREYWYTVVAIGPDGKESEFAAEVSATPDAGLESSPHILPGGNDDRFPEVRAGQDVWYAPKTIGGEAPYQWSLDGALPAGLSLDAATGAISGTPTEEPAVGASITLNVTDAQGRSDARTWLLNPPTPDESEAEAPAPPTGLVAVAGNGCVVLSWQPSPTPGVVGYRIKRSTAPLAQQDNRVYFAEGAPQLERYDYVVLEREFQPFDMKYVHPRVRGIGNPVDSPNYNWRTDSPGVRIGFAPHEEPPAEMVEPGESCLRVEATEPGEASINQIVFIGTDLGNNESIWYGQLEPGEQYRLEVWLRQDGLAEGGKVTFSYGRGYPGISTDLSVSDKWAMYSFDFTGPERPRDLWHFGHMFSFTGPGTLYMDNCRIFRVDADEDAQKPYAPNATTLAEFMDSQPATGPKGAQRCWVLSRDAKMDHILSLEGNSQVRPDWSTSVNGTVEMTLPCALEYCRLTGEQAGERVAPWIVIQHILHDENEWHALIEYLAAPYDPAVDTPEAKPWAHRRYEQRGTGTPWTDEFRELIIEFGNETWHNGVFEDWLGFNTRNAVWQGGREYGMFCQYLIENIKESPYWESQGLDGRIRFALGDGYIRREVDDGAELTYGEEAIRECPDADLMVHANYVGPKWETGDSSSGVFDDHGVQMTLLAYQMGNRPEFARSAEAHEALAAAGHEYDIAAYESGPSGYTLPGQGSSELVEVNERYGKSLAMGVAALDAWLGAYEYGWTYQNFLGYGQGQYWNSHTWFSEGFRPSPGWLALKLRNRFASGDYMAVECTSAPSLAINGEDYSLVGAYAFRDGDTWSVFVLSRKLEGAHDGADFGDGATPVRLALPFTSANGVTLHRLTGDPRESNRQAMNIDIETLPIPASALEGGAFEVNETTGGVAGGMPPGSIYLYVFEGAN